MIDYKFDDVLDEFLAQLTGDDKLKTQDAEEKQDVALQADRS